MDPPESGRFVSPQRSLNIEGLGETKLPWDQKTYKLLSASVQLNVKYSLLFSRTKILRYDSMCEVLL